MANKLLVITGASRGIGKATAVKFSDAGYDVVNISRSEPGLEGVVHLACDLADLDSIAAIEDRLLELGKGAGQITLIHNAGLLMKDDVRTIASNLFQRALNVNVVAPSALNTLLIPLMPTGSSILYVGSTLAEKAVPNTCSYVVSKHAQLGLMRATCQDLAGTGVHTAGICPGFTATEMLGEHVGGSQEVLDAIAQGNAMGRLIEPEEIAATLFFASQNPVLNGAVIHANLGQLES